jgi:hypothetical protein
VAKAKSGGGAPFALSVEVGPEFRALARSLHEADADIQKMFQKATKDAGKPLVEKVKTAVESLNSKGYASGGRRQRGKYLASKTKRGRSNAETSLRKTVARGVRLKSRFGKNATIEVICDPRRLPPEMRTLPMWMDKGKWRHPLWGEEEKWVTQTVSPVGWFTKTAERHGDDAYRIMVENANRLLKKIG